MGDDLLNGDTGDGKLYGDDGNDDLYGGNGQDLLFGGAGNDIVAGGTDEDILNGNDGIHLLSGGGEDDIVNGDRSNGTFLFGRGDDSDVITDFQNGLDLIDICDFARSTLYDAIAVGAAWVGFSIVLDFGAGDMVMVETGGAAATLTQDDFLL